MFSRNFYKLPDYGRNRFLIQRKTLNSKENFQFSEQMEFRKS